MGQGQQIKALIMSPAKDLLGVEECTLAYILPLF